MTLNREFNLRNSSSNVSGSSGSRFRRSRDVHVGVEEITLKRASTVFDDADSDDEDQLPPPDPDMDDLDWTEDRLLPRDTRNNMVALEENLDVLELHKGNVHAVYARLLTTAQEEPYEDVFSSLASLVGRLGSYTEGIEILRLIAKYGRVVTTAEATNHLGEAMCERVLLWQQYASKAEALVQNFPEVLQLWHYQRIDSDSMNDILSLIARGLNVHNCLLNTLNTVCTFVTSPDKNSIPVVIQDGSVALHTVDVPDDDVHKLLKFYLRACQDRGLRRKGKMLLCPVFTDEGHATHYYEPLMSIEEFVYNAVFPNAIYPMEFAMLTKHPSNPKNVIHMLENVRLDALPDLKVSKNLFSFRNGIFDIYSLVFYEFEVPADMHPESARARYVRSSNEVSSDQVSCVYHNMEFRIDDMLLETRDNILDNVMNVSMPPIYKILEDQGYQRHVPPVSRDVEGEQIQVHSDMVWILGAVGRLLYEVNLVDKWSFALVFLGVGGAGKSTLLNLLITLIGDISQIGILNNRGQETFGLQGMQEKRLVMGLDIDENFRTIEQGTFNSLVAGESVSVTTKNKEPVVVEKWKSQLAFACNRLMAYKDKGGSFKRRLFIAEFNRVIRNGNPNLQEEMVTFLDKFLMVLAVCYRNLVVAHRTRNFLDAAPVKFRESVRRHVQSNDPLCSFMMDCCTFESPENPVLKTTLNTFKAAYAQYCKDHNLPRVLVTEYVINQTLSQYGCSIHEEIEAVNGRNVKVKYVNHLCLNDDDGALL